MNELKNRLITEREMLEKVPVARQTLHRFRKEGMPYVKTSGTIVLYDLDKAVRWMKTNNKKCVQEVFCK